VTTVMNTVSMETQTVSYVAVVCTRVLCYVDPWVEFVARKSVVLTDIRGFSQFL
jgi:hypothetical protein